MSNEAAYRRRARATLSAANIAIGQDFASLTDDQLAAIRAEAEAAYLAKRDAATPSAIYIRKRYDLLQRRGRA
jgi:hypothetical protein